MNNGDDEPHVRLRRKLEAADDVFKGLPKSIRHVEHQAQAGCDVLFLIIKKSNLLMAIY